MGEKASMAGQSFLLKFFASLPAQPVICADYEDQRPEQGWTLKPVDEHESKRQHPP